MTDRAVSTQTLDFIKASEGCRLKAYQDGGGVWTIGYGHTEGVREGDVWTQETADFWLLKEVQKFQNEVRLRCLTEPNENQLTAMVSLCYNIGVTGFARSAVCKFNRCGMTDAAADAFRHWRKDNGKVVPGLVNRRKREAALYLTPVK